MDDYLLEIMRQQPRHTDDKVPENEANSRSLRTKAKETQSGNASEAERDGRKSIGDGKSHLVTPARPGRTQTHHVCVPRFSLLA